MCLADVDSFLRLDTEVMGRCVTAEVDTKLPMSPFRCTARDKRTLDAKDMPGAQLIQSMMQSRDDCHRAGICVPMQAVSEGIVITRNITLQDSPWQEAAFGTEAGLRNEPTGL